MSDGENNATDLSKEMEAIAQRLNRLAMHVKQVAGTIEPRCLIDEGEAQRLRTRFWVIVACLVIAMISAIALPPLLIPESENRTLWMALCAGFAGSTMAALRSVLDRRAKGLEDKNGNQWPEPWQSKERFSVAMSPWFVVRPFFGIPMGALAYWVVAGKLIGCASENDNSPLKIVVTAFVAGLFAKTVIEILLKTVKEVFNIEG